MTQYPSQLASIEAYTRSRRQRGCRVWATTGAFGASDRARSARGSS